MAEQSDANLNIVDAIYYRTPLSWAALNEHGGVVRIPLEQKDLGPNTPDREDRAMFSWTAPNKHEGVIRLMCIDATDRRKWGNPRRVYRRASKIQSLDKSLGETYSAKAK